MNEFNSNSIRNVNGEIGKLCAHQLWEKDLQRYWR